MNAINYINQNYDTSLADIHILTWIVFLLFSLAHMVSFIVLFGCGGQHTLTNKVISFLKGGINSAAPVEGG